MRPHVVDRNANLSEKVSLRKASNAGYRKLRTRIFSHIILVRIGVIGIGLRSEWHFVGIVGTREMLACFLKDGSLNITVAIG